MENLIELALLNLLVSIWIYRQTLEVGAGFELG
jgi:hypothetical protein